MWLAPTQAILIPISDRHIEYANEVQRELSSESLRVDVDIRNERMNQKIRLAQMQKIPYMLIVGDKEKELGGVAVRLRSGEDLGIIKISDLVARIKSEIGNRE